jgi:four helix bundle protein
MAPYERLEAWQVTHQLAVEIYFIARRFPSPEKFDLGSQARRAAFSAPANIAEGMARRQTRLGGRMGSPRRPEDPI